MHVDCDQLNWRFGSSKDREGDEVGAAMNQVMMVSTAVQVGEVERRAWVEKRSLNLMPKAYHLSGLCRFVR